MIWPFNRKEKEETPTPPFQYVYFSKDGTRWKYSPSKDITAYETALIAPAFINPYIRLDYITYFEKHNLMRHFVRDEDEV